MSNKAPQPKSEPRAIELGEVERYAMDAAVAQIQAAQNQAQVLASRIVSAKGWPANTKVSYMDGKLVEV